MQTDFSDTSEQLFSPITSATKDMKAATERAIWGEVDPTTKRKETPLVSLLEKIADETEKNTARNTRPKPSRTNS